MLILSGFRKEKRLLVLEEKMGLIVGKSSLKGACCYLSRTSLLKPSWWCEWLWSRQLKYLVSCISQSRRKQGNSASHWATVNCSHVGGFQMTQISQISLLRKGLQGRCSPAQPTSAQRFHFAILTNHFTHCHFFLPAHVIEKRHMETSMQTLQTFQHSFKTNANQFFETSFFSPLLLTQEQVLKNPRWFFLKTVSVTTPCKWHRASALSLPPLVIFSLWIPCTNGVTHGRHLKVMDLLAQKAQLTHLGKHRPMTAQPELHQTSLPPLIPTFTSREKKS